MSQGPSLATPLVNAPGAFECECRNHYYTEYTFSDTPNPNNYGYVPLAASSPGGFGMETLETFNSPSVVSNQEAESNERTKIEFHLSHLFPVDRVRQVMQAHPDVNDVHDLCKYLIDLKFKS
jgi:hypothetical protein